MIRGHLLQLKMRIPFSEESLSEGRPWSCQSLNWTSSLMIRVKSKLDEVGIYISFIHLFFHKSDNSYLYSAVKGPKYEIKAADRRMLPTKFLRSSFNSPTLIFQRTLSLANPLSSFSALAN
jgi:hypothetical protein